MRCVLDTHYVLWTLFEPQRIGEEILTVLQHDSTTKYVSGISFWEISLKYSLGKLELFGTNPDEIYEKALESGLEILSVDGKLFASYYKLPKKDDHKNPFDKLLIRQAIDRDLTIVTDDEKMSHAWELKPAA